MRLLALDAPCRQISQLGDLCLGPLSLHKPRGFLIPLTLWMRLPHPCPAPVNPYGLSLKGAQVEGTVTQQWRGDGQGLLQWGRAHWHVVLSPVTTVSPFMLFLICAQC